MIYLIDGGLAQDFEHIAGLAQLGALSWLTQDFIVVGVETVDRRRELAFPVERDAQLKKDYPTAGESARFRTYLVDEVKPFVEARYRTSGEDALLGESLAGLFTVETFLRDPGAFDSYLAMDPSLWWDEGRLSEEAGNLLAGHDSEPRRLWLSVGKETLDQPGPTETPARGAARAARTGTALRAAAAIEPRDDLPPDDMGSTAGAVPARGGRGAMTSHLHPCQPASGAQSRL